MMMFTTPKKEPPLEPKAFWDIPYTDDNVNHCQKLDLFQPPRLLPGVLVPVVLHVHGGGWQRGDRKLKFYGAPFMGRRYSEEGFVTVLPSYRLASIAKHPAQVIDVSRALKWVCENIAKYGGDPDMIFLSGHSAGGHIVSLLTLHSEYLRNQNLPRSTIKGVISISGIYYLQNPMHTQPPQFPDVENPPLISPKSPKNRFDSPKSPKGRSDTCSSPGKEMPILESLFSRPDSTRSSLRTDDDSAHSSSALSPSPSSSKAVSNDCSIKNSMFIRFYVKPNFGEIQEDYLRASPLYQLHVHSRTRISVSSAMEVSSTTTTTTRAIENHSEVAELQLPKGSIGPLILKKEQPAASRSIICCPFLLLNAQLDLGLEHGAAVFHKALLAEGIDSTHETIPGTSHGSVTRNEITIRRAVLWLKKQIARLEPTLTFSENTLELSSSNSVLKSGSVIQETEMDRRSSIPHSVSMPSLSEKTDGLELENHCENFHYDKSEGGMFEEMEN